MVSGELVTNSKLNQMAAPTVAITGTADSDQITNDSVTAAKAQFGAWFWCSAITTSNVITLTASGHAITLVAGMIARFEADATTTGAVDIVFGGATDNLFRYYNDTTSAGVELAAGDIRAGQVVAIVFDGTQWQMLSPIGNSAVVVGTDAGSTDAYAISPSPSVRDYADLTGVPVVFKANTANTGAATLEVSSLGSAKTIVKSYNLTLSDGDIKAGQWVTVVYDGTNFQLQSPVTSDASAFVRGVGLGIVLKNTSGAAGKVDLTATGLTLKNAGGFNQLASSLSALAIDMDGGTGLMKRDTGIAAVGWWYVYAVGNGTSVSACLSTSSTGPDFTNMAGYSYYALVGAVYCSATGSPSTLNTVYQVNRTAYVNETATGSTADTAGSYTAVASVSTIIPPIAITVFGSAGGTSASVWSAVAVAANSSGLGAVICGGVTGGVAVNTFCGGSRYEVPLPTPSTFYYKTNYGVTYRITIAGYTI